jgi:hypothetical protein
VGVVADFVNVPADAWSAALSRVSAAGVEVREEGAEGGVMWYSCVRGACRVGLAYCPDDAGREATVYGPALRFWRRPLGMWRLSRVVRRALCSEGGRSPI